MKILFITSNRVGDAVLSTGLLSWLVTHHPDAQLTIACGPYAADLFGAVPRLERLIILRKQSGNLHWFDLWRACIGTRWDLIVDLRNSIVSRLLIAKKRAYHKRNPHVHKVAEIGGILNLSPPPTPHIWVSADAEKAAMDLLPAARPILALGPAANWAGKQWPIERFAELAAKLTAEGPLKDAVVMVFADSKERAQIQPLLQSIPPERRVELIGNSLLTVTACLKQARLFIGNDSGLMHLAAAVGTPTLGLFGPGYEDIYGPWGTHCAYVRTPESREELLRRADESGNPNLNLMGGLEVATVCDAAQKLLAKQA